jgi:hypothetical protein
VQAGGQGGLGGIPPALQILGEICSDFFERTPPLSSAIPRLRGVALSSIVATFASLKV